LLGESIMTCNEECRRPANLEDVLDIDEKHLSSTDEGLKMLTFVYIWLLLISEAIYYNNLMLDDLPNHFRRKTVYLTHLILIPWIIQSGVLFSS